MHVILHTKPKYTPGCGMNVRHSLLLQQRTLLFLFLPSLLPIVLCSATSLSMISSQQHFRTQPEIQTSRSRPLILLPFLADYTPNDTSLYSIIVFPRPFLNQLKMILPLLLAIVLLLRKYHLDQYLQSRICIPQFPSQFCASPARNLVSFLELLVHLKSC